ncbi:hypothetical protein [Saccharopolyspora pogona]|uniref:hypothetical protein n=1 Tax=Saccharopolyspora pogona TaxID=333966 RepID=UPI001CC23760|nr:hypothetical protein [Saccharopolyspora pogona]
MTMPGKSMTAKTTTNVSPMPLMELTSGVYAFKTMALADQLGLFTSLAGGRHTTVAEFAAQHGARHAPH